MSDEEYPKMVYPGGASVQNVPAGQPHGGVVVHSKEEEDEAMKDAPKKDEEKSADKPKADDAAWIKP